MGQICCTLEEVTKYELCVTYLFADASTAILEWCRCATSNYEYTPWFYTDCMIFITARKVISTFATELYLPEKNEVGWNWKSRVSSSWTVYVVWSCDFICRSWDNYMIILLFVYITNHVEVEGCNLCWWKLPLHKTRELLCTDEVMDLYPL